MMVITRIAAMIIVMMTVNIHIVSTGIIAKSIRRYEECKIAV
jgi:hypothetical protein